MNIREAKEQIERAVSIYLEKDSYGNYRIPTQRQRPVFLLGAPGIGKTAIMEQIAQEMNLALVSYSMTHHTRQSALGLPFISHKNYGGTEFDVSEYTMSEIIASVYETMEKTGKAEGILFLDEINCVSETLAPSMLQFLQYKTFGKHRVPAGWVVATAGNPPQFNRSVREFDVVTMDRMKVLEVEADYETWRQYAVNRGIHGSVITYLDIKKNDFYVIENTVDGKSYVTARGWEDLSETIYLYEENGYAVDEILVGQYLRNKRICREFSAYYDLYQKYKKDYRVQQILSGQTDADVLRRAKEAGFDERISLIGLLLDAIQIEIRENVECEDTLRLQLQTLKEIKQALADRNPENILKILREKWESLELEITREDEANALSDTERREYQTVIQALNRDEKAIRMSGTARPEEAFDLIRNRFDCEVAQMKKVRAEISEKLSNLFRFVEKTFGAGNEMLILVTDLTVNRNSALFISRCSCREYEKYNKKFQIYERQQEIEDAMESLQLNL
ncbi:MAG: AAA family ATPase [Clostridiales bacterium]|nr:AAA family ATPase [Clostridiales bacterium]